MRDIIRLVSSLVLVVLAVNCMAQISGSFPVYSDQPEWIVREGYFNGSAKISFKYEGVDTFCGYEYSIVDFNDFDKKGYIRVEGDEVYGKMTKNCDEKEFLLYDFSIEPGESVFIGNSIIYPIGPDTTEFKAVIVDTIRIENQSTKRIKLLYDRCNENSLYDTAYWIKGVGSSNHPFFSFRCLCDICEVSAELVCMKLDEELVYSGNYHCAIDVSTKSTKNVELKVYPIPFDNVFMIESTERVKLLGVYNMNGVSIPVEAKIYQEIGLHINVTDESYQGILQLVLDVYGERRLVKLLKK